MEQENLQVITAHSGGDGLFFMEKQKQKAPLSLIVLDVMLPDLDGFQVLQKIRERDNTPVLMLTAKDGENDKVTGTFPGRG